MSTGLYLYALTRGLSPALLEGRTGVAGAPLRLIENEGLAAVVSEVDLEEFGEDGLKRNLEDLAWLEAVATAHDRVTREVAERAPAAPVRLATVFLSDASVRESLARWHDRAERTLDRIEGRGEWSVKVYSDPSTRGAASSEEPADDPGMGAGRAYLLKRRAATQRKEAAAQEDAETAEQIHAAVEKLAVAGRRLAPQDRRLTGHVGEMILNGTYLVDRDDVAAFKAEVDRLADLHDHLRIELAGPWPPYSFASLETS
ncbi:MAG TPA: GvpL/GvpF family gas vesicle protein [Nocardioidaceae bacterium]|nr:GvpL/GvpF family gas vesicle protein [Nocardioidaceae bacterium]